MVSLNKEEAKLKSALIGNCGYYIFRYQNERLLKMIYRSKRTMMAFEEPY